jgi:hypothetical protein
VLAAVLCSCTPGLTPEFAPVLESFQRPGVSLSHDRRALLLIHDSELVAQLDTEEPRLEVSQFRDAADRDDAPSDNESANG